MEMTLDQRVYEYKRTKNSADFAKLYEELNRGIRGLLLKIGNGLLPNDPMTREALYDEAIMKAIDSYPMDSSGNFRSWLTIIYKNEVLSEIRKRRVRRTVPIRDLGEAIFRQEDTATTAVDNKDYLENLLRFLTPIEKRLVELRCLGYGFEEIRDIINRGSNSGRGLKLPTSTTSVFKGYSRAIERVRESVRVSSELSGAVSFQD